MYYVWGNTSSFFLHLDRDFTFIHFPNWIWIIKFLKIYKFSIGSPAYFVKMKGHGAHQIFAPLKTKRMNRHAHELLIPFRDIGYKLRLAEICRREVFSCMSDPRTSRFAVPSAEIFSTGAHRYDHYELRPCLQACLIVETPRRACAPIKGIRSALSFFATKIAASN